MRILPNLTRGELDAYVKQPTAKKLRDKTLKEGIHVPEGDKDAAAVYMASQGQGTDKAALQDDVEISADGYALQEKEDAVAFSYERMGDFQKYRLRFDSTAMISRAVKQGYVDVEGHRVLLSDEVKKQLLTAGKEIEGVQKRISAHNFLLHEAASARQNQDAMKKASDQMSRVMLTASRIMHGRKVSPADEKELMEFNKDLYAMAKSAAALEQHRRRRDEEAEDEKVSADNDRTRQHEAEPEDYSVEEITMPGMAAEMTVDLGGEMPAIDGVGAVLTE